MTSASRTGFKSRTRHLRGRGDSRWQGNRTRWVSRVIVGVRVSMQSRYAGSSRTWTPWKRRAATRCASCTARRGSWQKPRIGNWVRCSILGAVAPILVSINGRLHGLGARVNAIEVRFEHVLRDGGGSVELHNELAKADNAIADLQLRQSDEPLARSLATTHQIGRRHWSRWHTRTMSSVACACLPVDSRRQFRTVGPGNQTDAEIRGGDNAAPARR